MGSRRNSGRVFAIGDLVIIKVYVVNPFFLVLAVNNELNFIIVEPVLFINFDLKFVKARERLQVRHQCPSSEFLRFGAVEVKAVVVRASINLEFHTNFVIRREVGAVSSILE